MIRDALDLYDLPFYNDSGETIPAYAVMQVDEWKDDANDRDYFRVIKPDGTGATFILNGPLEVADNSDGMGTRHDGMPARYASGTPTVDQTWGPASSSWDLASSGTGFNIVGGLETIGGVTIVRVSLAGGGGGGSRVQFAEVTVTVTPGTSWATPGSGTVQPKDIEGLDDGPPVGVVNFRPEQFDVGYIVTFDPEQVDSSDRRLLLDGVCAGY